MLKVKLELFEVIFMNNKKEIDEDLEIKNIFWKLRKAWIEDQKNKEETVEMEDDMDKK